LTLAAGILTRRGRAPPHSQRMDVLAVALALFAFVVLLVLVEGFDRV
jgi:hypothetical protein